MARLKSVDRRKAIIGAAIRVIAAQGLSAPTAVIAREAGVSNGSLFTYFATKADLFNQLYVDLKAEMASAALSALPSKGDFKQQMACVWARWLKWSASNPEKRRTLLHLAVAGEITAHSRELGQQAMAGLASLLEQCRKEGAMRDAPLPLVAALLSAVADTTVDFMIKDPSDADVHCALAFEGVWRMLS